MLTVASFVVVLGILVFLHEFGHFVVAKRAGVRVDVFSLGFGSRLFGRKIGETDYRVSAVPLGGYVKMAGEDPADPGAEDERSFARKSVGTRTRIILAGPLMNLLLPFLLMPLVYVIGVRRPAYLDEPPVVGWVVKGSAGQEAGIQRGDRIERIEGQKVATWEQVARALASATGGPIRFELLRHGSRIERNLTLDEASLSGEPMGLLPEMPPVVGSVVPGGPAARGGMRAGDRVVAIDGNPIEHWSQMAGFIQAHGGDDLRFEVRRAGKTLSLAVRPEKDPKRGVAVIGVAVREGTVLERYGPWRSARLGFEDAGRFSLLTFEMMGKLFSGGVSIQAVGGPIAIAQMTGEAARSGITSLIAFVAFLSLQLGILNLLPIPILDGGHLAFLGVEAVIRRRVNVKIRETAQQIGFLLLLLFFLAVSYNDILRILPARVKELFN
jgi:regulator of sigma E protease